VIIRSGRFGFSGTILVLSALLIGPLRLAAQVPTTTGLSLTNNSPFVGEMFPVQVNVVPVPPIPPQVTSPPSGTVKIVIGSLSLGTATIDLTGSAQFLVQVPFPGTFLLQAVYSGDTNYIGSTSQGVPVTVTLARSTVSAVQVAPVHPVAGQTVSLGVAVSAFSPSPVLPTGYVTFTDNGAVALGTAVLNGSGSAVIITAFLPGTHLIVASYNGDANFIGSSSPVLTVVVQTSLTITSLGASPALAGVGQNVALTAGVATAGSGGIGSPSGTVTFMDGTTTLGAAPLNALSASMSISTLALGTHILTAVYSGDVNFSSSTSGPVVVTVQPLLKVSLAFSEGTSGLVFTSTVTGSGTAGPTGNVQFNDVTAGKTLATGVLVNGTATATLSSTIAAPAGHLVQAVYSGDSNYPVSSSGPSMLIIVTGGFLSVFSALAPDEIATIFGNSFSAATISGPPSTLLGNLTVTLTDAKGAAHAALLLYVSATHVNFVVPGDAPLGPATLTLKGAGFGSTPFSTTVSITIARVNPLLAPVGQVLRVHANGLQESPVATAQLDPASQSWIPVPIPYPASSTDTLYLVLYATGFRHGVLNTVCDASGQALTVQYSGAQFAFAGLDQINALVPSSLQAAGQVRVECTVDGQTSNTMTLDFE
jgi:uncharacterized protein (TIGR03437 family)